MLTRIGNATHTNHREAPEFHIRISGKDVSPETMSISALGELLITLEQAVLAASPDREPSPIDFARDAKIGLTGVKPGSSYLTFHPTLDLIEPIGDISKAMVTGDVSSLPSLAISRLEDMRLTAIGNEWDLQIDGDVRLGIVSGRFRTEVPFRIPDSPTMVGKTTLSGRILLIGGKRPRLTLELRNGQLVKVKLTHDQVLALRSRVYQTVALEGEAIWLVNENWRIKSFTVEKITPSRPDKHSLSNAFRDLAEASQERWKGIDAQKFVDDLREDDDR